MTQEDNAHLKPGNITVTGYLCRCGHVWVNKDLIGGERPRVCPKCKSANWDQPYRLPRPKISEERDSVDPQVQPRIARPQDKQGVPGSVRSAK